MKTLTIMKKHFALLIIFSAIFFTGCQEEDFLSEETQEEIVTTSVNSSTLKEVAQQEIPDVLSTLRGKMSNKASFYGNKIQQGDITVYLDIIKEMKVPKEHANYSFALKVQGAPPRDQYMMSIDKYADGTLGEPVVTKYTLSQKTFDYILENEGVIDYRFFKAIRTTYDFDQFFNSKSPAKISGGDCAGSGSLGADPGEYPTMNPGETMTHGNQSVYFGEDLIPSLGTGSGYVTNLFIDVIQTTVSAIGTSANVTATNHSTGISTTVAPDNLTASMSANVESGNGTGGGGGCGPFIRVTGIDGGVRYVRDCPDASEDSQRTSKVSNSNCPHVDHEALNLIDLRLAAVTWYWKTLDADHLKKNREFLRPLLDFYNCSIGNRANSSIRSSQAASEVLAKKIQDAVIAKKITEVEGLQILYYVNNEGGCTSNTIDFSGLAIDALEDDNYVDFEDEIISELTGKSDCLHEHLVEKGNTFIKDIMKKFEGESKFGIKIVSKDIIIGSDNEPINGRAKNPKDGVIVIEISTSQAKSRPALGVVRTIIHEYIHADMHRKLRDEDIQNTQEVIDFRLTYDTFNDTRFEPTAQHETMAKLYVNEMAKTLKAFHKDVLVGDYNYLTDNGTNPLPDEFYEGLAWSGLKQHNVQAWQDLGEERQNEILAALEENYHATTKNCPSN